MNQRRQDRGSSASSISPPPRKFWAAVSAAALVAGAVLFTQSHWVGPVGELVRVDPKITKDDIAQALTEKIVGHELPATAVLDLKGRHLPVQVAYALDMSLQNQMQEIIEGYRPDYAAFVAIDATTGRVLSLLSYNPGDPWIKDHLALRATFPSASVFKVVTAAAAISERKVNSDTMVSFSGRRHTLYRSHLFKDTVNRWTTHMTLKEAFALSINTVFGKLGVFTVGPAQLRSYADLFGFNRKIDSDLPVQQGKASISDDPWAVAQASSGFTRENTMSPLQGALIAASIVNGGKMMEPWAVSHLTDEQGKVVYENVPKLSKVVIDERSAGEMRELMRETVLKGTSKGAFRGFRTGKFGYVDVGGKTGSLTGLDPAGKYDWFVGYGVSGEHRIAVSALVISKEYWKVKSSHLARRSIEIFFGEQLGARTPLAEKRVASRGRTLTFSQKQPPKSRAKRNSERKRNSQR